MYNGFDVIKSFKILCYHTRNHSFSPNTERAYYFGSVCTKTCHVIHISNAHGRFDITFDKTCFSNVIQFIEDPCSLNHIPLARVIIVYITGNSCKTPTVLLLHVKAIRENRQT